MNLSMSTNKKGFLIYIFIFIIVGAENCFYLVDRNTINIGGVFNYTDIFMVLGVLWGLYVMIKYQHNGSVKYRFKYFILFILVMAIISSIKSESLYGQPFYLGLRPQRFWIVWSLLYFPIYKLIYIKRISYDDLEKMLYTLGTIELVLYIFQFILSNKINFLYMNQSIRYGEARFFFENVLLNLLLFLSLNNLFNKKAYLKNTIYVVAIIFFDFIVCKMRMTSLGIVLSICIGIILWRKGGRTKVTYVLLAAWGAFFIYNLPIIGDTISTLMKGDGTLAIRKIGRDLYFSQLSLSPLLGRGYINELSHTATTAAGFNQHIYLVDNGIFAFIYMYGLLGISWFLLLWTKIYKMAFKILIRSNTYIFLLFMAYLTVVLPNELQWYWVNRSIIFTIFICMLETKYQSTLDFNKN